MCFFSCFFVVGNFQVNHVGGTVSGVKNTPKPRSVYLTKTPKKGLPFIWKFFQLIRSRTSLKLEGLLVTSNGFSPRKSWRKIDAKMPIHDSHRS